MSQIVGESLVARSLFLDVRQDFIISSKQGLGRFVPSLLPAVFVKFAMAVDVAILLAVSAMMSGGTSLSSLYIDGDFVQSLWIAPLALWLFYRAKLHRVEVIGDYRRYLRRFPPVWGVLLLAVIAIDILPLRASSASHAGLAAHVSAILIWFVVTGMVLATARYALSLLYRHFVRQEIIAHDVVIVGATELAAQFIQRATADGLGIRVKGIFDDNVSSMASRSIAGVPVCGGIDDLLVYNKRHAFADVVIALPLQEDDQMHGLVRRLSMQPLKISMLPGPLAAAVPAGWCAPPGELPGIHLISIKNLPIGSYGRLFKGAFDKLAALFALVFFGPVLLACAIGIKLSSPGPVLFRQPRIGYRNREFNVFKFRSMHMSGCNTGKLTVRNDPRVFAFGQVLRKFSLDELPQLFNVLLGDMSLVGPRPHMPEARAAGEFYFDVVQEYAARHRVKPGITGWAQVNGWRGPTETLDQIAQRVLHDLHYIDNWSFWMDIKILLKTSLGGFFGKNAF